MGKAKLIKCSKCGHSWKPNEIEPKKTWNLVSPMPDKEGRITVTVMAVWTCPNCGANVRGVYAKIKVGADDKVGGANRTKMLIEALSKAERINLNELAEKFKVSKETIVKAIKYLIKTGKVSGRLEGEFFVRQ